MQGSHSTSTQVMNCEKTKQAFLRCEKLCVHLLQRLFKAPWLIEIYINYLK